MARLTALAAFLLVGALAAAARRPDSADYVEKRERFLNSLASQMTFEEMAQQIDLTRGEEVVVGGTFAEEDLERLFGNVAPGAIHDFYPWNAGLANKIQKFAVEKTRLKIPVLLIEECLHGLLTDFKTLFPQSISMAATFEPGFAKEVGQGIAAETRTLGIHMCLSPVLDLAREPRWGRVEEGFGEDSFLASKLAVAMITGMQGESLRSNYTVASTLKHFAGHGVPEGGRNAAASKLGMRDLREAHFKAFEAAVREAGARGIMASYNEIDGIPVAADPQILTKILRKEWGFTGMVISDLGAIRILESTHRVAKNAADAIEQGMRAGISMQFYDYPHNVFNKSIVEGIQAGRLPLALIRDRVLDVLRIKYDLGLFENPYTPAGLAEAVGESKENSQLALEVARRSVVLLKNEQKVLPLRLDALLFNVRVPSRPHVFSAGATVAEKPRIAIIGPNADQARTGDYSANGVADDIITLRESLETLLGDKAEIVFRPAIDIRDDRTEFYPVRPSFLLDVKNKHGLLGEYFDDMEMRSARFTRLDSDINFNWYLYPPHTLGRNGVTLARKNYSVRWSGFIRNPFRDAAATATGPVKVPIKFMVEGSDSARVFFDADPNPLAANAVREIEFKSPDAVVGVRIEYTNRGGQRAVLGWSLVDKDVSRGIADAVEVARTADVVILVAGENPDTVGEGIDRQTLDLPGRQPELVRRVSEVNSNTVLVLFNGRPLTIKDEKANPNIKAIVEAFFPGQAGGQAVAEILLGKVNPSGRLPISFPVSVGELPVYYDRKGSSRGGYTDAGGDIVLYPFGFGLSYTTFRYSDLSITPARVGPSGIVTVRFTVTVTGGMPDAEDVPQVYVRDVVSSVTTPDKMLKGFRRVSFSAAEPSQVVEIDLDVAKDLGVWNREMKYVVEPGMFEVFVSRNAEKADLFGAFEVVA